MDPHNSKKTIEIVLIKALIILSIVPLLAFKGIAAIFGSALFLITLFLWLKNYNDFELPVRQDKVLLFLFFSSPVLAILITQLLRQDLNIGAFDGPIRFIFAVPLFIYILNNKFDFAKIITWSISISLILLLIYVLAFDQTRDGQLLSIAKGHRLTVQHLDPIIFGNYSIILAFCCLISVNGRTSKSMFLLLMSGFMCGVTLSILSQSRSGWIAGFFMLLIFISVNFTFLKSHYKISLSILFILFLGLFTTLSTNNIVSTRFYTALNEIYLWFKNPEIYTSTGTRLSMWKLGSYLFSLNPFHGYGDKSFDPSFLTNEVFLTIGKQGGVETIYCCGPHNELLGHMLRSGLFGIAAFISIFFVPLYFFLKFRSASEKSQSAVIGICFISGMLITGLSSEMLSLKFTFTFYALIVSILLGQCLRNET